MLKPKLIALAAATVTALAAAPSAHAATDYFMRLDPGPADQQITGESTDQQYKGYIQIKSFSMGIENPTTIGSMSGGAGAGKAKFDELTINKAVDSTTPQIMQRIGQGQHFAGVEIVARRAGAAGAAGAASPTRYYFAMAFPTADEQTGDAGEDGPQETIKFAVGETAMKIVRQTPGPGAGAGAYVFGSWNQLTNSMPLDKLPSNWN